MHAATVTVTATATIMPKNVVIAKKNCKCSTRFQRIFHDQVLLKQLCVCVCRRSEKKIQNLQIQERKIIVELSHVFVVFSTFLYFRLSFMDFCCCCYCRYGLVCQLEINKSKNAVKEKRTTVIFLHEYLQLAKGL